MKGERKIKGERPYYIVATKRTKTEAEELEKRERDAGFFSGITETKDGYLVWTTRHNN